MTRVILLIDFAVKSNLDTAVIAQLAYPPSSPPVSPRAPLSPPSLTLDSPLNRLQQSSEDFRTFIQIATSDDDADTDSSSGTTTDDSDRESAANRSGDSVPAAVGEGEGAHSNYISVPPLTYDQQGYLDFITAQYGFGKLNLNDNDSALSSHNNRHSDSPDNSNSSIDHNGTIQNVD
jgi:hypothetical protein